MTFPSHIKGLLLSEIESMDSVRDNFSKHPGIDFSRKQKLGFKDLIHFQISMETASVNHELMKFFSYHKDAPTLSAFYQQRSKLSDDVYQELFYRFNFHFSPTCYKDRYQLLACDGSSFTFSRNAKDVASYYDSNGRSLKWNVSSLVPSLKRNIFIQNWMINTAASAKRLPLAFFQMIQIQNNLFPFRYCIFQSEKAILRTSLQIFRKRTSLLKRSGTSMA